LTGQKIKTVLIFLSLTFANLLADMDCQSSLNLDISVV